jgi:transcriptional regulator with XRE-family HTH domain
MAWNAEKFAARLRQAREAYPSRGSRPWSREKAAVALGFTRNTLDNYERGVTFPTVDAVARIADYYGVTIGWLIGITDEGGPDTPEAVEKGSLEPQQVFSGDPSPLGVYEMKSLPRN